MKKLTLFMAAAFIAAMALTGCAPSTESSDWLKGTTWKADLAGVQCTANHDTWVDGGIIDEGFIKIHFTITGYRLAIEYSQGVGKSMTSTVSRLSPDYNYPELNFPFVVGGDEDNPEIEYSTGIISEDFKTIHFDTFKTRFSVFRDIDFTR